MLLSARLVVNQYSEKNLELYNFLKVDSTNKYEEYSDLEKSYFQGLFSILYFSML